MIHELGAGGVISERWIRGSTTDLAMLFSFPGTRRLFARNRSWFGPEMASIYEAAEPDTEPNWRDREYRDEGPRRDQSE